MRRVLTLSAVAVAVLSLTACGGTVSEEDTETASAGKRIEAPNVGLRVADVFDFEYKLDDGRTVTCVYADGGNDGGLSCDWASIVPSE